MLASVMSLSLPTSSYFAPWARKVPTNHPKAQDEEVARKLWEWCAEQVEKVTGEKAVPA